MSDARLFSSSCGVQVIDLPEIPPSVDISELGKDLRLLTPSECARINALHLPDGRYSKHDERINTKHTVFVINGVLYAVFRGEIGQGAYGRVKPSQNMQTGKWDVCKIIYDNIHDEAHYLHKMGLLAVVGDANQNVILHAPTKHIESRKNPETTSIFMRYIPGKLLRDLRCSKSSAYELVQHCMQLINMIKTHSNKRVVHNDLHQGNIIYNFIENKMDSIDFGEADDNIEGSSGDLSSVFSYICGYVHGNIWLRRNLYQYLFSKSPDIFSTSNLNIAEYCDEMLNHLSNLCISMPESEKTYHIGLVDINDCKQGKVNIPKLEHCSEVWFVDTNNKATLRDYVNARQLLQRQRICIGNKVFKHASLAVVSKHVIDMCEARHPGCCVIINDGQRHDQTEGQFNRFF
jgi:hypothetical protein